MVDIDKFKEGIFISHTRRFGTIAEIMIKKIYNMNESNSLAFDKINDNKKIEIKFSRVLKEHEHTITEENIITEILSANYLQRRVKSTDNYNYDCNIQQVKPLEFDELYYGLFFDDKILIFKINSHDILNIPGYSARQHRGNIGEGQFHINQNTLNYHYKNYLLKELNYQDLYEILGGNKN